MGTIGRTSVVKVNDGGGATEVQNILSADLNGGFDLADDTTNDSDGYKENAYADRQVTLDVTCKYAETGGIQDVFAQYYSATPGTLTVTYQPLGAGVGTKYEYVFTARISSCNISSSTGETIETSFTLESTGSITYQLQS